MILPARHVFVDLGHNSCRARQVQLFRQIVTVMGRSPYHQHLFFKFQSATSPHSMYNHCIFPLLAVCMFSHIAPTVTVSIALEAFPDVRWGFVFRDSVQTMMSHLDPAKVSLLDLRVGTVCSFATKLCACVCATERW